VDELDLTFFKVYRYDHDNRPCQDNAQCKFPEGWGWSTPACDYEMMEISCEPQEIPEFPTIALPIAAILGLAFFSSMSTVKISTKLVIICNL